MQRQKNVLIVGAGSRIGAHLVHQLGGRAVPVSRRAGGLDAEILVENYAALPSHAFRGVERIVNCVGVTVGPAEKLDRVNVALPVRIAELARDAGVRQFVHVSSFSVYGNAEEINRATIPAPIGDYGRSKLAADRALMLLATPNFTVTSLRLPLVYASDTLGKLGQLIRLWSRVRFLPIPPGDINRAMIAADLAAEVLARLVSRPPIGGVLFAADPMPFTYHGAARSRTETLVALPLPSIGIAAARRLAPKYANRLLADSQLSVADNLTVDFGLSSRLYRDIAKL